jgi:hypothetical protein
VANSGPLAVSPGFAPYDACLGVQLARCRGCRAFWRRRECERPSTARNFRDCGSKGSSVFGRGRLRRGTLRSVSNIRRIGGRLAPGRVRANPAGPLDRNYGIIRRTKVSDRSSGPCQIYFVGARPEYQPSWQEHYRGRTIRAPAAHSGPPFPASASSNHCEPTVGRSMRSSTVRDELTACVSGWLWPR